jgi:Bacterial PH domain
MQKYLLVGEQPLIADHQHWAIVAVPVGSWVAGLVLVLALDTYFPASSGGVVTLLWYAFLVLSAWAAWKVALWRRNWLVATDKRMLLNHGLINVDVAMLSLSKVVDLTYSRTTMGRLLGYGTFVRESAGQFQTLRQVEWVKKPERNYNILCAAIFNMDYRLESDTDGPYAGGDLLRGDSPPPYPLDPYAGFGPVRDAAHPRHGPVTTGGRRGIRSGRAGQQQDDSDSWHPDPNVDQDIHDADTGEIPTDN